MTEIDIKAKPVEKIEVSDKETACEKFVVPDVEFEISPAIGPVRWLYIGSECADSSKSWFDSILNKRFITVEKAKLLHENSNSGHNSGHTSGLFGSNDRNYHTPPSALNSPPSKYLPITPGGHTALDINAKYFFYRYSSGFDKLIVFRDNLTKLTYQVNNKNMSCSFAFENYTCPSCFETECECYVRYCPLVSFSTRTRASGYSFTFDSVTKASMTYPDEGSLVKKDLQGNPLESFVSFLRFVAEQLEKKHYSRILIE